MVLKGELQMKDKGLFVTLALGLSLTFALLWILGTQSPSSVAAASAVHIKALNAPTAELHVCPSGCAYSSVQVAVDAASDGDIIKVATGTYTDVHVRPRNDITTTGVVTQVVYLTKTLTIEGGYTTTDWTTSDPESNPTTLDAEGQGRVMYIVQNSIQPTVQGLRLTGGDAVGLLGDPHFRGVDVGGGVFIMDADPTVELCRIYNNTADEGGGLWLNSTSATLISNMIVGNTANEGGGLNIWFSSDVTLTGNSIISNTAKTGGGLSLFLANTTLDGNTITANTAGWNGGGLYLRGNGDISTFINNVIADNQLINSGGNGSGMSIDQGAYPRLVHTTVARNSGGDGSGICVTSSPDDGPTNVSLENTIFVSHSVGISVTGSSTVTVNGILWYNTPITVSHSPSAVVTVQNQHTGDPNFAPDGYHLTAGSAAIDKGIDAGITSDIDGEPRPARAGYDLGADELWHEAIYLPLVIRY
jgi:hypothetical protein